MERFRLSLRVDTEYYCQTLPNRTRKKGSSISLEKAFDNILLRAVDDALTSLGDSAKQSIYFHLEDKFNIKKKNIPNRLGDFEAGLERIFGMGARFLEIMIMKNLYSEIEEPLEWQEGREVVFIDYVEAARLSFKKKGVREAT